MPDEVGWGMPEPSRRKGRGCPVRWSGRQAVATLPRRVGQANADRIGEDLLTVIDNRPVALILDMTATVSCDHRAAEVLMRVYQRAVASGTELRLVIAAAAVRRAVTLSGLDQLVPVLPAVEAAPDEQPALAAVLPLPRRPACIGSVTSASPEKAGPPAGLRGSGYAGRDGVPDAEPAEALSRIASHIFRAGLTLQDALDQPVGALRRAAEEVLDLLDDTARDARTAAFARLAGSTSGPIGAELADVVLLPGAEAVPGLLGTTNEGIVPRSRLLAVEAAQHRARSRDARARTLELASLAAAAHDRIATNLSQAAISLPLHARRLQVGSETAASRAVRMRQWAADHAATG